eukprot:TRINITY_DN2434_c0_g2_i1.p1 TRINITY_DN2434_c0_g2~~TRINITY_DN2434_c0_g2_i1.p1  ORF type:complete len:181 (+),score=28.62 TRINITY_DN2434_c0_g2_i1:201-743(+)
MLRSTLLYFKKSQHPVGFHFQYERRHFSEVRTASIAVAAKSNHSTTNVTNGKGTHSFILDEPKVLGGNDTGPTPLETLLGAYCGCLAATSAYVAKKSAFQLGLMTFEAKGTYDPSMFRSASLEGNPTHFRTVEIKGTVTTSESEEKLRELMEKVERMCPISSLLHAAKVNIKAEWKVNRN